MFNFDIFTDSGSNLTDKLLRKANVIVVPMEYYIDGKTYLSGDNSDSKQISFVYNLLRKKSVIKTSLINADRFEQAFKQSLDKGKDVLYIGMSSGLSGTYMQAKLAADSLHTAYPDRKIITIDSVSGSLGLGLLVYYAAEERRMGKSIEQVADWLNTARYKMQHYFTVNDLMYLKRGGRLSGASALAGTVLHIKPIIAADNDGKLVVAEKQRGRKAALDRIVALFKQNATLPQDQIIGIGHADCIKDAEYLADKIRSITSVKDIIINCIDPVFGSHCGPDCIALFYFAHAR